MAKSRRSKKNQKDRQMVSAERRLREHQSGYDRTVFTIPDNAELFSIEKPGNKRIIIIPFPAGKDNPHADEGELYYERTYWRHAGIGPDNGLYICSAKTWKKRCYVDEYITRHDNDPDIDHKTLTQIKPKERQLFNVLDMDEKEKGVQIWEISYHNFGKLLDSRIRNRDEDDNYHLFADPEEGSIIRLTIEKDSLGGREFSKVTAIDFKPFKKPLDGSILKNAHCLDDLLIETPYKKLKSIFLQADEEGEDEDEDSSDESNVFADDEDERESEDDEEPDEEEEPEEEEDDEDDEDQDLDKVGIAADDGDKAAVKLLTKMAKSAGIDPDEFATWAEVAEELSEEDEEEGSDDLDDDDLPF